LHIQFESLPGVGVSRCADFECESRIFLSHRLHLRVGGQIPNFWEIDFQASHPQMSPLVTMQQ